MSDAGTDPAGAPASAASADSEPRPAPREPGPRRDTAHAHEGWARVLAALAALLLGALTLPGPNDFPLDDAWIHLSYAKSLRLHEGMSYNPGDWELGFSSPLWALLLSVWPIDGATVRAVQLLGLLLHAVTAGLAAHLGLQLASRRATVDRPLPVLSLTLLCGALAAATPTLVQAVGSGMEVSLTAALVLAVSWAVLLGHPRAALLAGALAVWARPEALGLVVALACVLVPWRWRQGERGPALRAPLMATVGAGLALLAWMAYCRGVAGQWWPNAQYVKGPGGGLDGLAYLSERVLPWQPWLVSLTGIVLLVLALRHDLRQRRPELLALLLAGLATWIAIAVSRPLDPAVLFYQSRYFAPFAVVFTVLLPFGLVGARRLVALLLVLPVAVVSGLQVEALHEQAQALRADTHQLHTAVAHHIEQQLPRDARVAVEGAGAPRFWAPRSMAILDLVGLNDHQMARHHGDTRAKLCHLVRQRPTHVAIPADWIPQLAPVFRLRPLARFDDPLYTQVDPPRPLTVVLMSVEQIHPAWVEGCAQPPP
ncbi:hypothetical protein [Paraliomyxa miuraensis]|uniref:hypothetical protein n=1 Tax=Paraliomyxa miuraensis TaxID=376150 RepID=UPI0022547BB4|nr:hypothetical protein [Paraliomyxa miuraensis]MCX4243313.1 hypothetical protein [Paraliomyxa miuraensis]